MAIVNWTRLDTALNMWRHCFDFQYIEVPYWVSKEAITMTFPDYLEPDKNRFLVEGTNLHLIASGEQGFTQLMLDDRLPAGKYCTITPCFRDDPVDDLHQRHFMKLEVIDTTGKPNALDDMISSAMAVFGELVMTSPKLIECPNGYDIEVGGLEVGSYGFREANGFGWVYGTGLAEPRFSIAVERDIAVFNMSKSCPTDVS